MKTTKQFLMLCYLMVMVATGYAQQWEIDYSNGESYIAYVNGILDAEGNGIMVGGCGPVYPNCHPIVMHIESDGTHFEREYEGFDGLILTDVVQLPNGNYFAAGVASEESVVAMVLDANLDIVADKRYEKTGTALSLHEGRLLLDDDGTVVMCGSARYTSPNGGYHRRPFIYRFDENADTLHCRYIMAEMPDPEYFLIQFECHQILKNPKNDGLILMGVGRNGKPALICYDHDFNYIDNIWMENNHMLLFTQYSSCCWLSDDDLLVFGTLSPNDNLSRSIALLDVNLSGGVPRLDTILAEPVLPYRIASNKYNCATFVNDTTIYGSYYSSENLNGPDFPSICLFDKDMEILGNKVFLDEEYTNHPSYFILPQNDGGCILVTLYTLSNHMTQGKLIKMNREDFNPIPCSVEEVPHEAIKALVYPNPAKEKVRIEGIEAAEVQVYNALGQVVKRVRNSNEINVAGLAEGVYLVRIRDKEGRIFMEKVMVW
jgi:hypothetical protein